MLLFGGIFLVTIQDEELKEGIQEAIKRANSQSKSVLVSEVQKINYIDPLAFFASAHRRYMGERFFWKENSSKTSFIGIGICKQIQSDQDTDRFFHVEKEWKRFIDDAIIYNEFSMSGTGPLMFGGFSFDPLKEKTELWSKFDDTLFHIPKFLLSIVDGEAFLTTNILCNQHDDDSRLYESVLVERSKLLQSVNPVTFMEEAALIEKREINPEEWKRTVTSLVQRLNKGVLKKTVLARELRLYFDRRISVENVLKQLLKEQEDSFVFAFETGGDCFLGASPERLVKKTGSTLLSTCLAGSIGRGENQVEDEELGKVLLSDPKNLKEHQFVVDMIKDAMDEVCIRLEIPKQPELLKVRDIQHLYTPVIGISKKDTSLFELVERMHPTPALGGLPKQEAIETIREIEELDRGFYGAPIGWMDYKEDGEFAVAIRSALIQGDEASLFAGCGIVKDSNAESEYLETNMKFIPMLSALGGMKK